MWMRGELLGEEAERRELDGENEDGSFKEFLYFFFWPF